MIPDERQAGAEDDVEVTEEMLRAGYRELCLWEKGVDSVEVAFEFIESAYRAMNSARIPRGSSREQFDQASAEAAGRRTQIA
jgi:hypothetical protein